MSAKGNYIYGFISIDEKKKFDYAGIDGGEVYTQPYQDIAAVVSDSPSIQFDSLPKETLLLHLAVYQAVIERVMKNHYIIPMKFGTAVQGEEEIKRILKKGYDHIKTSIIAMEDKIELDVVAMWSNLDAVLRAIGEEEEIKKLKEEANSKPPDQKLEAGITLGKMVKTYINRKRAKYASEMLDALKKESKNHRTHDVMDDFMIMNVAFLINKDNKETFESKIDQMDEKYQGEINFRIVGPLPPYSFCTLEMKKVDFSDVIEAREMFGLGEESTTLEIREAYWELSKKFHPDRYPGAAEVQKRFENITRAYRLLSDYCEGEQCSFKEKDVREWLVVKPLEQPGAHR
ncbi:MAG: GvpL/GvpF family gas vesicle protein [Syntrophales bacterium]|nr:GvpL/GvpF family gas vesicle protein [Syntrophales bacterium]